MVRNIIILHGWASRLSRWQAFKQSLETEDFQVFLPALPGFNQCQLDRAWDLNDYADWLEELIEEHQLKSFCLLGHSFGGRVAINFAGRRPDQLKALVLVNSAGIKPRPSLKKLGFLILAKLGRTVFSLPLIKSLIKALKKPARWLLYGLAGERDYFKAGPVLRQTMKKVLRADLEPAMARIEVPTLIVWGREDQVTPLKHGRQLKKAIAKSKLIVYDDIGHKLPFEKTTRLSKEVLNFCREHD